MITIKKFRESQNLKQEDLAKIINVSAVNYSKKENGNVKFSLNEARVIAQHFNKSIEELFFNDKVSKKETT